MGNTFMWLTMFSLFYSLPIADSIAACGLKINPGVARGVKKVGQHCSNQSTTVPRIVSHFSFRNWRKS